MKSQASTKFTPPVSTDDDDDRSANSESQPHEENSLQNDASRGNSGGQDTDASESSKEQFVREENQRVRASKFLVYAVLFACAAASAIATWFFVRGEEKNQFEDDVSSWIFCCAVSIT